MEDTTKRLDHGRYPPVNKEADILDQLKCCEIYFQCTANNNDVRNTSQFYDTVRVLIGILPKLPSELEWCTSEMIQNISTSLICIIAACSLPLDGQMMCSAALCSALNVVFSAQETETLYNSYLNTDGYISPDFDWSFPQIGIQNLDVFKLCLCHGILQSSEASNVLMKGFVDGSPLIYDMLNILEEACMKYSRHTSIAFKVLVSWVKMVCVELKLNMTGGVLRRMLSVINSNWESPINGVKEQNIKLFELFLDVCSANRMNLADDCDAAFGSISSLLHYTMEGQPWKMKSKYCILSVLLPRYGVRKAFADFPDLASGLVSSLSYSHLVSAASGVYKSCLKDMDADDWTTVFMPLIVEVLSGRDVISIQKQNAFNYWIPSTLKKFPLLLNSLLDQLIDTSQSSSFENAMFSVISLLKLGQKGGLLFNKWDENFSISSFKYLEFLNFMNSAMRHSSEAVRSEAFAVVCMSSKSYIIPSLKELEMVQMFLLENVNNDSPSLREAILKSFAVFLTRIRDSSVHALEVEQNTLNSKQKKEMDVSVISQNIQFLNWMHNFLISNLEPGTNYQRRVLSLQLYLLILSYFCEPPELIKKSFTLRKKGTALEGKKVMEYALTLGQWPFISEGSHKTILSCVLDSSDDVRETAGLILMEYFSFDKSNMEGHKPLVDYALQLCTSSMFYETESGALLMKVLGKWTYKIPIEKRNELLCSVTRMKCNQKLTRNRNHGSSLMLYNQQKLLAGLENKPTRTVHNKVESRECTKVELIKKVKPYEGMLVMHPSLLEDFCKTGLSDETKIFEGMTVVAKDGLVGQCTASPVAGKSYSVCNKQTCLVADSSNNRVYQGSMKSQACNMKKRSEMPCGLRDSHASMKCGVGHFFGNSWSSSQHSLFPPKWRGTSYSRENNFLIDDPEEFLLDSASEETSYGSIEHMQNIFHRQDRQAGKEQEADCYSDIQTSRGPLTSHKRLTVSRKRKTAKKLSKGKQGEVTLSSRLHKHEGFIVIDSAQDNQCNSPAFSRPRDFEEFAVLEPHSAFSSASSSSGYESPKFQQRLYFKSSVITDADIAPLHARSPDRKHNVRINSSQKNKEFRVPRSGFRHCHVVEETWEDIEQIVKPDDWDVSKSSRSKSGCKSESNMGASGCRHPSKIDCKSVSNIGTSSCQYRSKNTEQLESENVTQTYNGLAPLSFVLLTQAEAQLTSLKIDLFQAVSSGSPLHGTLTALIRLATQSDSPECGLMSAEEVNRTVALLEQTVSFFLHLLAAKSVSTADVAPSFAEMDEAIQSSIQQSLSDLMSVDEEELQLSPARQLVLNCVWLNLKAGCTLASGLVCSAKCSVDVVKRCGRLITQVLTRCRHKGAIESAGVALSMFVKSVTSQTAECNLSSDEDIQLMLEQLLTEFLDSLVCEGKEVSVTRRSAGLSILIHKILANDMQTGKPLLHMCMSQLLKIARSSLDFGVSSETKSVLVDLPQAQALHFLKILVQDSSLRQDIAQYMSQVTIICFNNFSSPVWTVRNAALQLSGALIPKLVGQKKIQDEEMTLGSGVSVEELFSHFPELTEFMLVSLQKAVKCHPSQALQQHADLIPMLSLLAKVAVGTEIFISAALVETIAQYRVSFLQLISSPIYHVRKLAAKAYERFTPFSGTYESIVSLVDKLQVHNTGCHGGHFSCLSFRENDLNGILLTLKYLLKKLKHDNENMPKLECKISEIITILKEGVNCCVIWDSYTYFNRALLLEVTEDNFNAAETAYISADETCKKILDVHKTLEKENLKNSFKPGLHLWAAKVIDVVLKKCCPHYLVSAWYNSYTLCGHYSDIMKLAFASLKWRLLHDKQIDVAVKASLFCALLKVCFDITEDCHVLFPLLDIMLVLIQETKLTVFITFKELQKISLWCCHIRSKSEYSRVALPVVAGLLSQYFAHRQCIDLEREILEFVLKFANCIRDRTDVLKYEEDFRLSAAVAMHLMAPSLQAMLVASLKESSTTVREEMIEILLDAELTLLQDEDHDVRMEAAKFVSVYTAEINQMFTSLIMNPYSSLTKLVQPDVLLNLLTVPQAMEFLWNRLSFCPYELYNMKVKHCDNSHENASIASPFDHGTSNIYSEETKVIDMLGTSLLDIIKIASEEKRSGLSKLVINRMVNFEGDAGIVLSLLKRIETCGVCSVSAGNETCNIVMKKLFYQSKVIEALRIEGNCDIEYVVIKLQQFLQFGANEVLFAPEQSLV